MEGSWKSKHNWFKTIFNKTEDLCRNKLLSRSQLNKRHWFLLHTLEEKVQSYSKHPKSYQLTFLTFAALTLLVFFGAITLAKGSKKIYKGNVYSKSVSSYFVSIIIGIERYNVNSALRKNMCRKRDNLTKNFPKNIWMRYFRHNTRRRLEFYRFWQFAYPIALTSLPRAKSLFLSLFGGCGLLLFALSLCHVSTTTTVLTVALLFTTEPANARLFSVAFKFDPIPLPRSRAFCLCWGKNSTISWGEVLVSVF